MRLNIACGEEPLDGYTNIDIRNGSTVQLVHDCLTELPYPDESVVEIRADDFLEHIPPMRRRAVLRDWWRILEFEGLLVVRVPNLKEIARQLWESEDLHWQTLLIRNIYGGHRWGTDGSLDCHHSGWTPELLERMLAEHGFQVVANDHELNMTVQAVKVHLLAGQGS